MINVVVDLSHHNNAVEFNQAKANGIVGVIHKATEGLTFTDSAYQSRRSQALDAGLLWGAYHFGNANDGIAQAEHFLSVVKPEPTDLLVLDFEQSFANGQPAPSMTIAQAEQFVTHIQSVTGRFPGLYSGSYIKELLGSHQNATLANCWFWLAQYQATAVVPPNWPTWTMWQYTDGKAGLEPHAVTGIGNCDRDKFNGQLNGLRKLWGFTT